MNETQANTGRTQKKLLRTVMIYIVVTLAFAALGAGVGWVLGSAVTGAIFGAVIGLFGCARSGHALSDPYRRPGG